MPDQKATVSLNFVVVGASLAGLGSAYALGRAGHKVVVVEALPDVELSSGTIGSSPSMTRILEQWGLQKQIEELFQVCDGIHDRLVQRPTPPTVKLATGEILEADLIIAADGWGSQFRRYIQVDEPRDPEHEELLSLIPSVFIHMMLPVCMEKVRKDKDLDAILKPTSWDYWLGDGFICHGNVSNHAQNSLFAIVQPFNGEVKPEHEIWAKFNDFAAYGVDCRGLEDRVQKLFGMADFFWVKIYKNRPLETIVSVSPKVILVGEAAHSILPGSHHFSALAFEDAQTLGYLFSRIQDKAQIPKFLAAYEDIRQPRLKFVYESELKYRVGLTSPDATLRRRRDQMLKRLSEYNASSSTADVEMLMEDWGSEFELMSYDATSCVMDWWRQYGSTIVGASRQSDGSEEELDIAVAMEVAEQVVE